MYLFRICTICQLYMCNCIPLCEAWRYIGKVHNHWSSWYGHGSHKYLSTTSTMALPVISFVLCYCIKLSLYKICCFYIFGRTSCAGTASVSASHMVAPLLSISLRKCIKQDIHLHISPSAIICFILVSFGFVIIFECKDSSWLQLIKHILILEGQCHIKGHWYEGTST